MPDIKSLNVLVACEESQAVCTAFRSRGHRAFSCDVQPCSGGHPEWHVLGDCMLFLSGDCTFTTQNGDSHRICGPWDIIIAHPPCTYLSNAGARHLWAGGVLNIERYQKGVEGKALFMACLNAKSDHVCVENPVPSSVYNLPKCSQWVQPYEYGHPYSKKTGLWLRGLPLLRPTNVLEEHTPFLVSGRYSKTHDPSLKGAGDTIYGPRSPKNRSKTFPGIAEAMATQWAGYVIGKKARKGEIND